MNGRRLGGIVVRLAIFVAAWDVAVRVFHVRPYLVPAPWVVARTFWNFAGVLTTAAVWTLGETVLGCFTGTLLGVGLAILIVAFEPFERALYPYFVASQAVPIVAFSAIVVMWVGSGVWANVAIAAYLAFFPVVVSTVQGLRSVDRDAVDLMRAFGATPSHVFRKLRLPAALPYFFVALKVAASLSLVGAIVGDFFGGAVGVGGVIVAALYAEETPKLWLAILTAAVLGQLIFAAIGSVDRRLVWWHATAGREEVI